MESCVQRVPTVPRPPMGIRIGNESFNQSVETHARKLFNICGYTGTQFNGQIIFKPEQLWRGPIPTLDCEVFIGKIPGSIFEDELLPVLLTAGPIYEFRLLLQFSGLNRGYAFARYATNDSAIKAVRTLNNYEIRPNQRLGVVFARQNTSLYLKNIPPQYTVPGLVKFIYEKTEDIIHVALNPDLLSGIIYYKNHRAAALGRKNLLSESLWRNTIVKWAGPPHTHHKYLDQVARWMGSGLCKQAFAQTPIYANLLTVEGGLLWVRDPNILHN